MYWVMVVVVAVVVFGVAAVAAGQGGAMAPADPDRPEAALPPGPLGPGDLSGLRFAVGLRGYRMDEVDRVLDRLIAELGARDERIAELEGRRAEPAVWREEAPVPHEAAEPGEG